MADKCAECGKSQIIIGPELNGTDKVLKRCPQHHWATLEGQSVPEPGSNEQKEMRLSGAWAALFGEAPAPKKKAAKKASKKKAAEKQ